LLETLKGDKKARVSAILALGQMGSDAGEAVPALEDAWKGKDGTLRIYAALALWQMGRHQNATRATIIEALSDEDVATCFAAVRAVSQLGTERRAAIPALQMLLENHDGWATIKRLARNALDSINDTDEMPQDSPWP
jgi:HEAT repeat protein